MASGMALALLFDMGHQARGPRYDGETPHERRRNIQLAEPRSGSAGGIYGDVSAMDLIDFPRQQAQAVHMRPPQALFLPQPPHIPGPGLGRIMQMAAESRHVALRSEDA